MVEDKSLPIRFRSNWRGMLIMQIEIEVAVYDRTINSKHVKIWRDAKLSDLPFNQLWVMK